ncbi:MAG TPA: hypothetical protein VJG30_04980 [Candidatus Nanoarchaeia archaeon]|nr:hypothetical protein [Candidatus Nanoarchaeia archaeon]
MKLTEQDIKNLYEEVNDLTDNFKSISPVIILHNTNWFKILNLLKESYRSANELTSISYSMGGIKNNENMIKYIAMKYWLLVNYSGHKTKSKFLDKFLYNGEIFISKLLDELKIDHKSQYIIKNSICGYNIPRLVDEFIYPNKVIEIKNIDMLSENNLKTNQGPIFELIGQFMSLNKFNPEYKFITIISDKDDKINKLPQRVFDSLNMHGIYSIYTLDNLEELKNVV